MPERGPPIGDLVSPYSVNHKNHRFESKRHRSANIYSKGELRALGGGLDALVTVRFMCGCRVRLPGSRWVPEWMVTAGAPLNEYLAVNWDVRKRSRHEITNNRSSKYFTSDEDTFGIVPLFEEFGETPLSGLCPVQRGRKAKLLLSRQFYTCYCSPNWYVFRRYVCYKRSPVVLAINGFALLCCCSLCLPPQLILSNRESGAKPSFIFSYIVENLTAIFAHLLFKSVIYNRSFVGGQGSICRSILLQLYFNIYNIIRYLLQGNVTKF